MRDTMTIDNAIWGGILWFITVHVYPDCTRSRQIQNPIPPADLLHISARTDAMRWFAAESRLKTCHHGRWCGRQAALFWAFSKSTGIPLQGPAGLYLSSWLDGWTDTRKRALMGERTWCSRISMREHCRCIQRNSAGGIPWQYHHPQICWNRSGRADGTRKLYQGSYYGRRGRDGKILPYPFFCPVGLTAFTTKRTPVLSMYI